MLQEASDIFLRKKLLKILYARLNGAKVHTKNFNWAKKKMEIPTENWVTSGDLNLRPR